MKRRMEFQRKVKIVHRVSSGDVGFTIVEMLVVIIVVVMLICLLLPAQGPPPPKTDADLDFSSWNPEAEKKISPPADIIVKDAQIAGEWFGRGTYVSLRIEQDPAEDLRVTFRSGGRCGLGQSIVLTRTATYKAGVLLLDRPVQTLFGKTFQRVYKVQIRGKEFLVPSVQVRDLEEIRNGRDASRDPEWTFLTRVHQQEP